MLHQLLPIKIGSWTHVRIFSQLCPCKPNRSQAQRGLPASFHVQEIKCLKNKSWMMQSTKIKSHEFLPWPPWSDTSFVKQPSIHRPVEERAVRVVALGCRMRVYESKAINLVGKFRGIDRARISLLNSQAWRQGYISIYIFQVRGSNFNLSYDRFSQWHLLLSDSLGWNFSNF